MHVAIAALYLDDFEHPSAKRAMYGLYKISCFHSLDLRSIPFIV